MRIEKKKKKIRAAADTRAELPASGALSSRSDAELALPGSAAINVAAHPDRVDNALSSSSDAELSAQGGDSSSDDDDKNDATPVVIATASSSALLASGAQDAESWIEWTQRMLSQIRAHHLLYLSAAVALGTAAYLLSKVNDDPLFRRVWFGDRGKTPSDQFSIACNYFATAAGKSFIEQFGNAAMQFVTLSCALPPCQSYDQRDGIPAGFNTQNNAFYGGSFCDKFGAWEKGYLGAGFAFAVLILAAGTKHCAYRKEQRAAEGNQSNMQRFIAPSTNQQQEDQTTAQAAVYGACL